MERENLGQNEDIEFRKSLPFYSSMSDETLSFFSPISIVFLYIFLHLCPEKSPLGLKRKFYFTVKIPSQTAAPTVSFLLLPALLKLIVGGKVNIPQFSTIQQLQG